MLKERFKEIERLSTLLHRMNLTGTFLIKLLWMAKINFPSSLSPRQLKEMIFRCLKVRHSRFNLNPSKLSHSVRSHSV